MSEPFSMTDEKRPAECPICTSTVVERKAVGLYGSVIWDAMPHDAPCGLPCLGGGVSIKVYRLGVHKTDSCPRCKPEQQKEQPTMYPCGCSKHKVNFGMCDQYKPGELP